MLLACLLARSHTHINPLSCLFTSFQLALEVLQKQRGPEGTRQAAPKKTTTLVASP